MSVRRSVMPYRGPVLIREPELLWPLILVAAMITTLIVLVTAGALHLSLTGPNERPAVERRLEGAIRPEMPGFERLRERIVVERLATTEVPRPPNDIAVEINGTVRNATNRTISGLEVRGAVLNARRSALRERTVVIVPARQTALEPGEAIGVRILLEGISPEAERAGALMEVTGVRVD
jgi:hypothetical protein